MNRKFTRLVSVCIGMAFCVVPVMGQEKSMMESSRSEQVRMQDVQLRNDESPSKLLDSIVFFSPTGEKMEKSDRTEGVCYKWTNNTWIPGGSCMLTLYSTRIFSYEIEGEKIVIAWPYGSASSYANLMRLDYRTDIKFSEERNENGKLTKLEYGDYRWIVEYNKNNNPKSITLYIEGNPRSTYNYEYLLNSEYCTLYEEYNYEGTRFAKEVNVWGTYGSNTKAISSELYWYENNFAKKEWEYDEDGDETIFRIYSGAGNQWILDEYQVSYYSDHTANEAVIASAPTAYAYGGTLYIQSPRAEQVTVYSLTGAKVYEGAVQAGTTTVNAARLPKGVYVVAFGDGTRQKVANN